MFMKYFGYQTVAKHSNSKIQLGISLSKHSDKADYVNLALDHVSGAFLIWGIGLTLAIIVFMIEIICYRYKELKRAKVTNCMKRYPNFNVRPRI